MNKFTFYNKVAFLATFMFLVLLTGLPINASVRSLSPQNKSKSTKVDNKKTPSAYSFSNPDFAFPQTVEKNAAGKLREAVANKNGVEALQAAIQVIVARNLVSGSAFNQNVNLLDSVGELMPQPYHSLFLLLEAGMYVGMYNTEPWTFNGRTLPQSTFPENVKEWSGDLFAKRVLQLVEEADADMGSADGIPLTEISPVLRDDTGLQKSGLTITDFIVSQSVDLLRNFETADGDKIIPFRKDIEKDMLSPKELCVAKAAQLLDNQISVCEKNGNLKGLTFFVIKKARGMYGDDKKRFLVEWKDKLLPAEEGGVILCEYFDAVHDSGYTGTPQSKQLYKEMEEWISRFPKSEYVAAVKYDLALLAMQNASVGLASTILPGRPAQTVASVTNINSMYVLVYEVPETMIKNDALVLNEFPGNARLIHTLPLTFEGECPFSAKVKFDMPPLSPGHYVVIPSQDKKLSSNWKKIVDRWSLSLVNVTNLSIITSSLYSVENSGVAYVVDAATQKPVEGAKVICRENSGNKIIKSGVTDKDGAFALPSGYFRIYADKDGNSANIWSGVNYSKRSERKENRANIFTDLSIYHPGDSVGFALVAWECCEEKTALKPNTQVKAVLLDANGNEADSLSMTTDKWGRCNGRFKLPANGLLGTWQIAAQYEDNPRQRVGYQSLEVAEYKTPTFYVELEKDSTANYSVGDVIKFKGVAKTYSGMPLVGAEVRYNVRWSPWWRWYYRSSNSGSYGNTLLTDEKGEFIIELPTENLKDTEFEWGIYTLTASATSAAGETQTAPDLRFALGSGLSVRPQIAEKICVDSDSVRFNVQVYDMLDLPAIRQVEYTLTRNSDGEKVSSGVFTSPVLTIPASRLPSGKYSLEFNVVGDTLKATSETVIYRKDDKKVPVATPLWVPENAIVAKAGDKKINVKVGSGYPDSYILCIISSEGGVLNRKWLKPSENIINVTVPAPEGDEKIWATFSGMHDFDQDVAAVEIVPESSLRKMEIQTSVFRDKLTAGDKEEWKFTFKIDKDFEKGIPALAVMTDKALNALAPFAWRFNAYGYSRSWRADVSMSYVDKFTTSAHFSKMPEYAFIPGFSPDWNTYSYGLISVGSYGIRIRGTRMMKAAQEGYAVAEMEDVAADAAPMMMNGADFKAEAEVMVLSEEPATSAGDGGSGMAIDNVEVRPVEMPLMFFMPDLKSDDNGEVTVSFDVPDFNTTWQFQLVGYNDKLMTANVILDAVASKPVMVRSNPPRYVRTGDKMTVAASLYNNTDEMAEVAGAIELFDPSTGSILHREEYQPEEVQPSGSRTVMLEYAVPANLPSIGIRSYALSGKFSDGEQTVIPVLPSSTPVVESTSFYLKTGHTDFSIKLPKYPENTNLTLKYCDNPVWECLLALPSIATPESKNIFSVMRALFANSMSLNIVDKYPRVREGLQRVFASADTPVVTSNLEKDKSLKTVSLNSTPWVNDARSETARMRSLGKLLDKKNGEEAVASLLTSLKDLQTSEGGWSWCPDMRASEFITQNVILYFGIMKRSGCMPDDAGEMVGSGIDFCDKKVYDNYLKADKKFYALDLLGYLYARSFFDPKTKSAGFDGLRKKALKKIAEEWKEFSIYNKAVAAILLSRSAGYEKTARVILESLNQYASKDEAKGWWFDNLRSGFDGMPKLLTTATALEAYSEIEPGTEAEEGLRQWLVLQKETENWGANSYTVEVIGAIMGSGADWTLASEPAEFRLGDKTLQISSRESLTGMVTVNLDPKDASGKELAVCKKSEGPAWGGVISQFISPIKEVKAEKSANLKLDKKLLVITDTPAGEVAKEGEIKVGDKVRVTLTLTCEKDMDYVALIDERGAFLEPADQLSGYIFEDGLGMYRETRDSKTSFFIEFLPKGVNVISYDCYADREGEYAVGIASVQSQYSPLQTAHSAGKVIVVK